MDLVLKFGFATQVIAAFVIFVLGYIGLFALLMIGFVVVRALYGGAKWFQAHAARQSLANLSGSSDADGATGRIPFLFTPAGTKAQPVEVAFHPVLIRPRVPGNY
jgi:hypothetical protein